MYNIVAGIILVSRRIILGLSVFFLVVLSSLVFADPSFSSGPNVNPATNITTTSSFSCDFTALGTGTITANVSWFVGGASAGIDGSFTVFNNTPASLLTVNSGSTSKNQVWYCNVTLDDDSSTIVSNSSSSITVVNSPPYLTAPLGVVVWYEDSPYSSFATATDPDGDTIDSWAAIDLNKSYFGSSLFTIDSSTGQISFTAENDSISGNHTISIIAYTGAVFGGENVIFDIRAVNDAPVLTTTSMSSNCIESSVCDFTLLASDEENDNVTFFTNESFINLNSSSGEFSFTPSFSQTGTTLINITVVDDRGANSSSIFTLEVDTINHVPIVTFQERSPDGISQNNASAITYTINVSDIDINDTINFTFIPVCDLPNPWIGTRLANGSGSTNASFVISKNGSITDNNSFVACRNITVTYFDVGGDGSSKTFTNISIFMNISNENDAPLIYRYANFSDNNGLIDINNLSTAILLDFYYRVNGSDPDKLTYEDDTVYYSVWGGNSSLFTINSSSGAISSINPLNESHLGNLSFFVNITDLAGLTFTESVNITVINNSAPLLDYFNSSDCSEDVLCLKTISVYDLDLNLENYSQFTLEVFRPELNSSGDIIYNLSNVDNFSSEEIFANFMNFTSYDSSRSNYTINFTPSNNDVGSYHFSFSFVDDFGAVLEDDVYFNISNINNSPLFDDDEDHSAIENITFPNVVEGVHFSKTFYVFDEDLFYDLDVVNVTFNLSSDNLSSSNISLIKINKSAFVLSFTPNSSNLGDHQINLTVTDSSYLSFTQSINFTVVSPGIPPVIDEVTPWSENNVLKTDFKVIPLVENVSIGEGISLSFGVHAHDDTPGDSLTVTWFKDGVQVDTYSYDPLVSSLIYFDYFDAGIVNITVEVTDLNFNTADFSWSINVSNTNRVPIKIADLGDLSLSANRSVSGPTEYRNFFSLHDSTNNVFFDSDDDLNSNGVLDLSESTHLTFTPNSSGECLSFAEFTFTGENLVLVPSQVGTCYINFIATDSDGANVSSNEIRIDILKVDSDSSVQTSGSSNTREVTTTINVPITQEVDVPKEFNLIIPGVTVVYENGTVVIPLKLRNTWGSTIQGIQLSANSSYDFQSFVFSNDYVSSLPDKATINLNLTMDNYRADGPFEINVTAYIDSLDYTDTSVIFVDALERGREDSKSLRSRIGFARDLLSDNPECEELNELLNEAEEKADSNPSDGVEILNAVISSCKYLVNEAKNGNLEAPSSFLGKLSLKDDSGINFPVLISIVSILFFGVIIVGIVSSFKLKKI